jgi:hypothetical protein
MKECQSVDERCEELISTTDEDVVLDGIRRAFTPVQAQACMVVGLFISAVRDFLLPALRSTWYAILKKQQRLDRAVEGPEIMARLVEVIAEIDKAIGPFEDLIGDIVL